MNVFILLFLIALVGGVIWYYLETQATKDFVKTTMPATQVIRQAVQEIGAQRRWTATGHSADFASFTYKRHASCFWAIVLALFWIIPGIVYMLLGSRTESLTVSVFPEPDGTSGVQVSASGRHASLRGKRFLRALPGLRTMSPQEADALSASVPDAAALPVGGQAAALPISTTTEAVRALPESTAQSGPAAGWYDDPEGNGKGRRYWDGAAWTDHFEFPEDAPAEQPASGAAETTTIEDDPQAPATEVSANSSSTTVYCHQCGGELQASDRFCRSCGTAQPTAAE